MVAIYACAKEIASQGIKLIMIRRMIKSETLIKKRGSRAIYFPKELSARTMITHLYVNLNLINLIAIPMDLPKATKEIPYINITNLNMSINITNLKRRLTYVSTPNKKEINICL